MKHDVKTAVLGAGVTGLRAAHALTEALGLEQVLVLEGAGHAGGHARTERVDGFLCDWGPNGFLDRDPGILAWIGELGLSGELARANEASAHRFIVKGGRLVELKPPPEFLFAPILSVPGRLRVLGEPFVKARREREGGPESIWDFAARRIGREAADLLVQPLVTGIFGGDARALSLEHCFPRMAAMEREHGSLFKALRASKGGGGPMGPRGTLTSLHGGMGRLTERAAELLGDRIQYETRVEAIAEREDGFVIAAGGGEITAESVVCALPAGAASACTQTLDGPMSSALAKIGHAPIAVVCVGYPREAVGHDMNGFGFLVPRNQGPRVLGCIWTSTVFPFSAPEGWVFLRCMFGGATDRDAVTLDDGELLALVEREVHPLMKIRAKPEFARIFRHEVGIPQYGLDHGAILQALDEGERRHPGFVLAGNAYRGVSLIDCVESGRRAAELIGAMAAGSGAGV